MVLNWLGVIFLCELVLPLPPLFVDNKLITKVIGELNEEISEVHIFEKPFFRAFVIPITWVPYQWLVLIPCRSLPASWASISHISHLWCLNCREIVNTLDVSTASFFSIFVDNMTWGKCNRSCALVCLFSEMICWLRVSANVNILLNVPQIVQVKRVIYSSNEGCGRLALKRNKLHVSSQHSFNVLELFPWEELFKPAKNRAALWNIWLSCEFLDLTLKGSSDLSLGVIFIGTHCWSSWGLARWCNLLSYLQLPFSLLIVEIRLTLLSRKLWWSSRSKLLKRERRGHQRIRNLNDVFAATTNRFELFLIINLIYNLWRLLSSISRLSKS